MRTSELEKDREDRYFPKSHESKRLCMLREGNSLYTKILTDTKDSKVKHAHISHLMNAMGNAIPGNSRSERLAQLQSYPPLDVSN